MLASQKGYDRAYGTFLSKTSELLIPFIRKRVDREEFIDDILQDTLISIHRSKHTYLPDRPLEAWIYVICNHRIIDFYRKFRKVEKAEITLSDEPESKESSANLSELLINLSDNQKKVITYMKVDGLSIKEVAQKMSMSTSAVKVTAFRGYEALRRLKGIFDNE